VAAAPGENLIADVERDLELPKHEGDLSVHKAIEWIGVLDGGTYPLSFPYNWMRN
jgi:hypothetical protein